jgi:hypothetical protein
VRTGIYACWGRTWNPRFQTSQQMRWPWMMECVAPRLMSKFSTIRMRAKHMSFWTIALTVKPMFRWPEQSSSRKLLLFWTLYSSLHDTVFGLWIQLFSVTNQENWRTASLIKQYNQKRYQPFCNATAPASLDAKVTQDVPRLG